LPAGRTAIPLPMIARVVAEGLPGGNRAETGRKPAETGDRGEKPMWGRLATCAAVGYRRRSTAKAAGADCQSAAGYHLPHKISSANRRPLSFSWDFAGRRPIQTVSANPQLNQRVDYSYDSNPLNGSYSQNAWGRLTAVQFQDETTGTPFSYMYSYNQAGRVTAHRMNANQRNFDAAYTWG
jgi:YD repeat-containing protein